MVTDAMLKAAATNAQLAKMAYWDTQKTEPHLFSQQFEKKIGKLVWRTRHPILFKGFRCAVAMVLLIVLLLGILLAASPAVRADFFGLFHSQTPIPQAGPVETYDYYLQLTPEGYALLEEIDRPKGKTYLYHNEEGLLFNFSYETAPGTGTLFDGMEAYSKESLTVGEGEGVLYTSGEPGECNVLIWRKEQQLLRIMGHFEKNELLRIAQSLQCRVITS